VAKALEATVPLDERYSPDQVHEALNRMLAALTFQQTPLRVEWYTPTAGRIYLAPFGYRQVFIRLTIRHDQPGQHELHLHSDPINMFRVPLLYRRELQTLWSSIVDRLRNLE
jgi:hypothetical protein